jgi:hypothetical protein
MRALLIVSSFKTRCKVLADQSEIREMQFKSILRHKDAEIAHLQAKHEVERRRADTEAGRCRTLTSQVSTFSHTEAELRSQLNIYVEKFKQVSNFNPTLFYYHCHYHVLKPWHSPCSRSKIPSTTATSSS